MLQTILRTRKQFTHLTRPKQQTLLEQVNTDSGRYYKTPAGKLYPSVTTVTGLLGKEGIDQWRKKVGEEEANKISRAATIRGTRIHQLLEDYINGSEIDPSQYSFADADNFKLMKGILDTDLDNIHLQEERLYSDYLEMAGTVDCVAEYKGKLAIVDFKTARKAKNRDHIKNYFLQATAYAIMYEERFNVPVNRIVIMISVDHDFPQVFMDRRDHHVDDLLKLRKQYKELYNV